MELKQEDYEIEYTGAALRDLKALPKKEQTKLVELADSLASNPRPDGVEPLTKFNGLYRVRTGNYRLVYSVEDDDKIVIIAAVGDRKNIYSILDRRFS